MLKKSFFIVLFGIMSVFGGEVDLEHSLSEFGDLKEISKEFYYQSNFPENLKLIWDSVLSRSDLSIHNLTEAMKLQHGFRMNTNGFAGTERRNFEIRERNNDRGFNYDLDRAVDSLKKDRPELFISNHTIFVEEKSEHQRNQSSILIFHHELAHIYLTEYLNINISKLVGKVPEDLVSFDAVKNFVVIDSQFLSYLQERFAHESEFQLFLELKKDRKWLRVIPPKWLHLQNYTFGTAAQKQIAMMVRRAYNLDDLRLSVLDSVPIVDLISGKYL